TKTASRGRGPTGRRLSGGARPGRGDGGRGALTSISKSGRRKAVRKREQKCAMAGTSHQERSSSSATAASGPP
ncbi:unnamed protein product, partial [Bubo scandiacus]